MISLLLLLIIPTADAASCQSCNHPCGSKGKCDKTFRPYNLGNCQVFKCEDNFYPELWHSNMHQGNEVFNNPLMCIYSAKGIFRGDLVWQTENLYEFPHYWIDMKIYCRPSKKVPEKAIISKCESGNLMCEELLFDPNKQNACSGPIQIEYEINGKKEYTRHIQFDKKSAKWRPTGNGVLWPPEIPTGTNAYCMYKCDKTKLFLSPDRCASGEQCIKPTSSQTWLYECPADYRLFVQYATEGYQTIVPSVECVLGKFQADNREPSSAKCMKVYCKHRNPLKSECPLSQSKCTNVTFDNEQEISCPDNYLIVEEGKEEMKYTSLECDRDSGKWFGKRETDPKKHSFNDSTNVFCMDTTETTTAIAILNTTVEPFESTTEGHATPIELTTLSTQKEVPITLPTTEVAETSTASGVALSLMLATAGALSAIVIILLICAIVLAIMLRRISHPKQSVISSTQLSSPMPSSGVLTLDRNSEKKETWENRKSKERRHNKGNRSIHAEIPSEWSKKEESKSSKKRIRPKLETTNTLGSFDS